VRVTMRTASSVWSSDATSRESKLTQISEGRQRMRWHGTHGHIGCRKGMGPSRAAGRTGGRTGTKRLI
jgi:hypothetical protein